jgi:hypothetical protein
MTDPMTEILQKKFASIDGRAQIAMSHLDDGNIEDALRHLQLIQQTAEKYSGDETWSG